MPSSDPFARLAQEMNQVFATSGHPDAVIGAGRAFLALAESLGVRNSDVVSTQAGLMAYERLIAGRVQSKKPGSR